MHVHESCYLYQSCTTCDSYGLYISSNEAKPNKNITPGQITKSTNPALIHDTIRRATSPMMDDRPLRYLHGVQHKCLDANGKARIAYLEVEVGKPLKRSNDQHANLESS